MRSNRYRIVAICLAVLVAAGATTSNASTLTVVDPNCTGFALSGVAPNQSLACVGGSGSVTSPMSVTIDNQFCYSYALAGVAPNQTLVCTSGAPRLVSVESRKMHGAAGQKALSISVPAGAP